MTGVEFDEKFEGAIDEAYQGYWLPEQKNRFIQTAYTTIVEEKIRQFQANRSLTHEILSLIIPVTVASPSGNVIDISPTSTQVPDYKQVIAVLATYSVNGSPKQTQAEELLYNQLTSIYGSGTTRYPKFRMEADNMVIYPTGSQCTSVIIYYFKIPFAIDVEDDATLIPYNQKMLELIIKQTVVEATQSMRDFNMANVEQKNIDTRP